MVGASEELEMGDEKDCASVMDFTAWGIRVDVPFL